VFVWAAPPVKLNQSRLVEPVRYTIRTC
jgi:hypothetical protein